MEYKSSINIPTIMFPFPATNAKIATSTGVEQGEDSTPPSIPRKLFFSFNSPPHIIYTIVISHIPLKLHFL